MAPLAVCLVAAFGGGGEGEFAGGGFAFSPQVDVVFEVYGNVYCGEGGDLACQVKLFPGGELAAGKAAPAKYLDVSEATA